MSLRCAREKCFFFFSLIFCSTRFHSLCEHLYFSSCFAGQRHGLRGPAAIERPAVEPAADRAPNPAESARSLRGVDQWSFQESRVAGGKGSCGEGACRSPQRSRTASRKTHPRETLFDFILHSAFTLLAQFEFISVGEERGPLFRKFLPGQVGGSERWTDT